jgi:hypothetical protein
VCCHDFACSLPTAQQLGNTASHLACGLTDHKQCAQLAASRMQHRRAPARSATSLTLSMHRIGPSELAETDHTSPSSRRYAFRAAAHTGSWPLARIRSRVASNSLSSSSSVVPISTGTARQPRRARSATIGVTIVASARGPSACSNGGSRASAYFLSCRRGTARPAGVLRATCRRQRGRRSACTGPRTRRRHGGQGT